MLDSQTVTIFNPSDRKRVHIRPGAGHRPAVSFDTGSQPESVYQKRMKKHNTIAPVNPETGPDDHFS